MKKIISRAKSYFQNKSIVLMYHKIGSPSTDPWGIAVSAENFETHLKILKHSNSVISSDELVRGLKNNKVPRGKVVLTFDDGYLDNFLVAKPLLEKYNIPATFFITGKSLEGDSPDFWWDELAAIVIEARQLPDRLTLPDYQFEFKLEEETFLTPELEASLKRYYAYNPDNKRAELYLRLWEIFSPLKAEEQRSLIEEIRSWAKMPARSQEKCLDEGQLIEMASNGLITIGGHTTSHPALDCHDYQFQEDEIMGNKKCLEGAIHQQVKTFAFPSGRYDDKTLDILTKNDFSAAYTTQSKPVTNGADPLQLGRYQVNDWNNEIFLTHINKWS